MLSFATFTAQLLLLYLRWKRKTKVMSAVSEYINSLVT